MNLKKLGLSLVIAAFVVAPTSAFADSSKGEVEVVNTVNKYFNAEKNHDLTTMLEVSTDGLFPDKETKEQFLGVSARQIISYEVSDVQKISDNEYTANIDVTYDDNEDYPKYPVHIIKDAGTWKLEVAQVFFYKDSNDNWYYEIDNSTPIPSINTVKISSTVAASSWSLAPGYSTSGSADFTYNPLYNLSLNGWQQPVSDYTKSADSTYSLMLKSGSTYTQVSSIPYWGTVYQSGQWLSFQFNNVTSGATYKVVVKNNSSVSCNGAFNIYN